MQPGSPAVSAGLSARCPELPQVLTCQYMGRSRIYEPLAIERCASASDVCEVMRREKQAWQGRGRVRTRSVRARPRTQPGAAFSPAEPYRHCWSRHYLDDETAAHASSKILR